MEKHHTSEAFANALTDMLTAIGNGLHDTELKTETSITPTTIKEWMNENLVPELKTML